MFSLFLNKTVTVKVATVSLTTEGGYTTSSTDVSVRGSFQPLSQSEALRYGRDAGALLARLYLPTTKTDGTALTVQLNDQVTIDSTTYRVVGPSIPDAYAQGYQTLTIEAEV